MVLLGSKSPRRKQLLEDCNIDFKLVDINVEETFPENMNRYDVPVFLSKKKSEGYTLLNTEDILLTSDTIVIHNDTILGKPESKEEAIQMLLGYSDSSHDVVTGVTLRSTTKEVSFDCITKVFFNAISQNDIEYYVDKYKPYDKAGAYGIQEYIGNIGIHKIEGSYNNVVGLPTELVVKELRKF